MTGRWPVVRGECTGSGFTLLEVVVALALLGLILGVSAVAVATLGEPAEATLNRQLIAARDSAIRSGKPVTVTINASDSVESQGLRSIPLHFLPDGRAVGLGVDPLTGDPLARR